MDIGRMIYLFRLKFGKHYYLTILNGLYRNGCRLSGFPIGFI